MRGGTRGGVGQAMACTQEECLHHREYGNARVQGEKFIDMLRYIQGLKMFFPSIAAYCSRSGILCRIGIFHQRDRTLLLSFISCLV